MLGENTDDKRILRIYPFAPLVNVMACGLTMTFQTRSWINCFINTLGVPVRGTNLILHGHPSSLNYDEQYMIARKLLGARKGYSSLLSGRDGRPCLKVMRETNLGHKAVHNNASLLRDLE